jgi:APA family basic amino acid/polyamine antiporter
MPQTKSDAPQPSAGGVITPTVQYARRLGLFSGTMLVIGGIIGSGIFLNPAIVAQRVGTPGLTLAAWVLGGAVALLGAFVFAELGARRPRAGGGYVYLRDAFGPLIAFLYAWALLLVMATGAIAAVSVTFARYTVALFGLAPSLTVPLAVGATLFLSLVNYFGVKPGAIVQNAFTVLKLAAIAALVIAGLALVTSGLPTGGSAAPTGGALVLAMGAALVPVLFAYGGWQQTNFVAEELIEPERNLPRALVIGVIGVVLAYVFANITYLRVLGAGGLAASAAPAADVMRRVLGPTGATVISAGIAVSTFGFLNLVILVSPRVYQTMAADGLFFPQLARLHPRYRTPAFALGFQAAWAVLLTLIGTYGQLLDYVVFGDWIFFALNAAALMVFRYRDRTDPAAPGFRVPGYPWPPLLFIAAAAYVMIGSIVSNPANARRGTLLLAVGIPVFWYWKGRSGKRETGKGS